MCICIFISFSFTTLLFKFPLIIITRYRYPSHFIHLWRL